MTIEELAAQYEIIVRLKKRRAKRPVPSFTAAPTGLSVAFTDTSTGAPTAWYWNFGDGNTSTDQNPTHSYATAGTYTVTLLAANGFGSRPVASQDVTVAAATATWDDVVADLNPLYWFKLDEASGSLANSGSAGGAPRSTVGTIGYRAGSLNDANAGIGVENGDGFSIFSPERETTTTILLIKTPPTLTAVDYVAEAAGILAMRVLANGALEYYDDLDLGQITSAAGVMKSNSWNLVAYQPNTSGASKIFHTSQDAGGVVSEVASGATVPLGFTAANVRGSSSADTAVLGAVVVVSGAVTLAQLQALADTLDWS